MAHECASNDENPTPFAWLDGTLRGSEYISYSQLSDLSACSFDFGNGGYAASSNHGGELLQMTAKSETHGVIFARGDFEYSLYLALARGQKESGGKSTFGLKIDTSKELATDRDAARYRSCCMIERGCFNYRWPFNEFCLHVDNLKTAEPPVSNAGRSVGEQREPSSNLSRCICPKGCGHAVGRKTTTTPVGSFSLLSFVKEGVLYQVLRLAPRCQSSKTARTAELTLTIESPMRLQSFSRLNQGDNQEEVTLGKCEDHDACLSAFLPTSSAKEGSTVHWQAELFQMDVGNPENTSTPVPLKCLEGPHDSKKDHCFKTGDDFDSLPRFKADLSSLDIRDTYVFVARYRISESTAGNAGNSPSEPLHQNIADFVLNGEVGAPGTGPMWQSIFNCTQEYMDCVSELCEGSVVGRCLEKILGVDVVPATIPGIPPATPPGPSPESLSGRPPQETILFQPKPSPSLPSTTPRTSDVTLVTLPPFKPSSSPTETVCDQRATSATPPEEMNPSSTQTRLLPDPANVAKPSPASKHTPALPQASPLALVSNMFLKANVDLKSLFWKTRFLIKVDEILSAVTNHKYPTNDTTNGFQNECEYRKTVATAEGTIRRVRGVISGIMTYLVRALLSSASSPLPVLIPEDTAVEPNYFYVMITICYLAHKYPSTKWSWQTDHGCTWGFGILGGRLPSRMANPLAPTNNAVAKVKYAFLEWLHYQSISSLQNSFTSPRVIPAQWSVSQQRIEALQYSAKAALIARLASAEPYRADDEIADRLAFLAEEMWPAVEAATRIASRITQRIEEREYTRVIDVCRPNAIRGGFDDGPWEVHALCHHSRLVVACKRLICATRLVVFETSSAREDAQFEVEHYRKKFYPFLTTEASLMPCWERNNSSARRGFLRSEATAVLASTILDIFQNDFDFCHALGTRRLSTITVPSSDPGGEHHDNASVADARNRAPRRRANATRMRHLRHTGEKADINALLVQQLDALERLANAKGLERCIDYLKFRPPQRYHPEEFFNSLDDTPELYDSSAIKARENTIPVAIRWAFQKDQGLLACPDSIKELDDLEQELAIDEDPTKRLRELLVKTQPAERTEDELKRLQACGAATMLRELTVIDLKPPNPLQPLKPEPIRGEKIVRVVSDSLIDQQVRHRFLLSKTSYELPVGLLRLLVYVLHPEMAECFNNHQLKVSRFRLWTREQTVVVHITLRSWALTEKFSATNNSDTIRLPDHLSHPDAKPADMELKVSSIGMSTNTFGDFSKCSIVTDLLQDERLIRSLGEQAQQIWDVFTHQPQTGRFVVFSVVLGLLCQRMVADYNDIMKNFLSNTQLQENSPSYLEDQKRMQRLDADSELRLSLWSLEALYKLSNTLATSVKTVEEAIEDMTREINQGPGKRSCELENICRKHMETLERSFSDLMAVQIELQRKVELNTRYTNALSAVLALRGSRDSYKQNNTIQKLTYITIGCLPVALSSAIFAIPSEQDVIGNHTGRDWFIGSVVLSFVAIFLIAYFLDGLLNKLRRIKHDGFGSGSGPGKAGGGDATKKGKDLEGGVVS